MTKHRTKRAVHSFVKARRMGGLAWMRSRLRGKSRRRRAVQRGGMAWRRAA